MQATPLTSAEIATRKITHNKLKYKYNEVHAIERALRKQITDAIEDKFLQLLQNATTGMIQCRIPDILDILRTTNGKLSPAQLE